ncbi:MAG: dienelactone hydrolase family protein [Phycisphaerales bacterium]|nr:dienelactone hydrolase family protein [Phycisphaerales bacterium]
MMATRPIALVVLVLSLAAAAVAAQDRQAEARELETQFITALNAKDYAAAITAGEKLATLAPQGGTAAFNLACAHVLSGDRERGITALRRAVRDGFANVEAITTDTDLVSLRQDAEFQAIVQEVRNNRRKQVEEFRARVEKAKPLIVPPPGHSSTAEAPVIVALHGFGSNADDIADAYRATAAAFGAILVAPRAVEEAPAGGFTWGNSENAEYIVNAALDAVRAAHRVDEKRLVLTGFSQGGWVTYRVALRNPKRFCAAIPVAGRCADIVVPATPVLPKFYIMVGEKDPVLEQNRQVSAALESKGATVLLATFAGVGHEFPQDRDGELRKALTFALGAPPAGAR